MATSPYLPKTDTGKAQFLANFAAKLPGYQATFTLTAVQVSDAADASAYFQWTLTAQNIYGTRAQDWTAFKNELRDGPLGGSLTPPLAPVLAAVPDAPTFGNGIFKWVADLVGVIKRHANYTTAIGEDLGIIGGEQTFNPQEGKPTLQLSVINNNQIRVAWRKGNYQGVYIEVDRGTGWIFLATDSVPDYIDTHALPASPTAWKYRAVYRLDDINVGQWSDVAQITVG